MRLLDLDITYENIDIIKSVNVDGIEVNVIVFNDGTIKTIYCMNVPFQYNWENIESKWDV